MWIQENVLNREIVGGGNKLVNKPSLSEYTQAQLELVRLVRKVFFSPSKFAQKAYGGSKFNDFILPPCKSLLFIAGAPTTVFYNRRGGTKQCNNSTAHKQKRWVRGCVVFV